MVRSSTTVSCHCELKPPSERVSSAAHELSEWGARVVCLVSPTALSITDNSRPRHDEYKTQKRQRFGRTRSTRHVVRDAVAGWSTPAMASPGDPVTDRQSAGNSASRGTRTRRTACVLADYDVSKIIRAQPFVGRVWTMQWRGGTP